MRFISQSANYEKNLRNERSMLLATGEREILSPWLNAKFGSADLTAQEIEQARAYFTSRGRIKGTVTERDEVTPIDPSNRWSSFDTDVAAEQFGWSDDDKLFAEQKLLAEQDEDYFHPEPVLMPPPWPNVARERHPAGLVSKAKDLGFTPEHMRAWEMQNENRPTFLKAIDEWEAALAGTPEEDLVLA